MGNNSTESLEAPTPTVKRRKERNLYFANKVFINALRLSYNVVFKEENEKTQTLLSTFKSCHFPAHQLTLIIEWVSFVCSKISGVGNLTVCLFQGLKKKVNIKSFPQIF